MARPTTTLIFVSRRTVARADFNGAKPGEFWLRPRPEMPDLISAVDLAISLEPNLGRRVWVLATDLWTQTATLPRARALGLRDEEMASVLNFEAESHSGVSAMDAAAAFVTLPPLAGSRDFHFWLTQVPLGDRDTIDDMIHREGSRLAGILHPGGLPAPVQLKGRGSFGRVELWPDTVVGLWSPDDAPPGLSIWNADPASERWHTEFRQWSQQTQTPQRFEWLAADGFATLPGATAVTSLDDENGLRTWLSAWAAALSVRQPAVPVVRPVHRPMVAQQRWLIAAGLALVAAAGCAAHWHFVDHQISTLHADAKSNQDKAQQLVAMNKMVDAKTKERDTQRTKREQREAATRKLQNHRTRIIRLMELLATGKDDDVVIQSIENENGVIKIVGLTLRSELADAYARTLHESLQPMGWDVRSGVEAQKGAGLWKFDLVIRDVQEPKAAPSTPPAQELILRP